MTDTKHIFVSYVREGQARVDTLVGALKSKGAEIWMDRESIEPGQPWRDAIRHAIETGNFFLACFSHDAIAKPNSGMNEGIALVTNEFQKFQHGTWWFLPVKFDNCSVPDIAIGAGQTLRDLQWVDLWSDWDGGIDRLAEITLGLEKQRQQAQLITAAREVASRHFRVLQSHFRRNQDSSSAASTQSAGAAEVEYARAKAMYDEAQVRYVRRFNEEFHPLADFMKEADERAAAWIAKEQIQWEDAQAWARTVTISLAAVILGGTLLIVLVGSLF